VAAAGSDGALDERQEYEAEMAAAELDPCVPRRRRAVVSAVPCAAVGGDDARGTHIRSMIRTVAVTEIPLRFQPFYQQFLLTVMYVMWMACAQGGAHLCAVRCGRRGCHLAAGDASRHWSIDPSADEAGGKVGES
jgi:hypothetical protein